MRINLAIAEVHEDFWTRCDVWNILVACQVFPQAFCIQYKYIFFLDEACVYSLVSLVHVRYWTPVVSVVSDFNSPVDGTSCSVIVSFLSCHFLTITFSICPTIAGVLCPHCHHSGSPHVIDVSELSEVCYRSFVAFPGDGELHKRNRKRTFLHNCMGIWL